MRDLTPQQIALQVELLISYSRYLTERRLVHSIVAILDYARSDLRNNYAQLRPIPESEIVTMLTIFN